MLIIGVILFLVLGIVIKLYDKKIRQYHMAKAVCNWTAFTSLLFIIVGIIRLFM